MSGFKNTFMNYSSSPQPSKLVGKSESELREWIIWSSLVLFFIFFGLLLTFVRRKANKIAKDMEKHETTDHLSQSPCSKPTTPTPPPTPPKEVVIINASEGQSELVFFVEEEKRFRLEDLLEAAADLQSQTLCSSLYKVNLEKNGSVFAVKRLKKLQVSFEEFGLTMREIGNLKHPNLLPLVGFNSTMEEKLLIYWYQSNGSLLTLLENNVEGKKEFTWKHRISIALGIAKGLNFIHHLPVITTNNTYQMNHAHGNLKPSNILLDENELPLISDYGYVQFMDNKNVCNFLPSNGYMAPEKALSEQADVYSFGVMLLELMTGKLVEKTGLDLTKWVKSMIREEWTAEVFDKRLGKVGMYAFPLLNISLKCVSHFPENRPGIGEVLEKIEHIANMPEAEASPDVSMDSHYEDSFEHSETWETPELGKNGSM
ncbi:probable inactive receptor kinase At2g26730 [Impatiens glandulifera]|uniref:probable inactive receptor kinase At2g26730 n=1 Tax=Impatiens glandulifera TaxID=253017 RepID=UPI001FB0F8DF|nr:probable inactive receptor kinase At2g26730 [Impatiens glandulifera]